MAIQLDATTGNAGLKTKEPLIGQTELMYKQFPSISEDELVSKTSILSIIEDWKNDDTYPGLVGVIDSHGRMVGIFSDGLIRDLPDDADREAVQDAVQRNPIVCCDGQLYQLGQNTKIRFGRDCSQNISKVPILDAEGMPLGLDEVISVITRQNIVVGLGYVGITLAAHMVSKGSSVLGVDVNDALISDLSKAKLHVREEGLDSVLTRALASGDLQLDTQLVPSGNYIVAVGTPVGDDHQPNYDALISSCERIAATMHVGSLVVFRSTVGVGTTRNLLVKELEERSGLVAGVDFHVSFSPERTAEGVALRELAELPQLTSGLSADCMLRAADFWRKLSPTIVECSSLEVAELAKLSNNTFRDISFAFANELAATCQRLNIDAHEVVHNANQGYVRNKIAHPSVGVGGYCLTKDPYIFVSSAPADDATASLAAVGREKNEASLNFPLQMLQRWADASEVVAPESILVVGVAFKGSPPTSDIRMSPSIDVIKRLRESYPNAMIKYFDHEFEELTLHSSGLEDVPRFDFDNPEAAGTIDAVFILNNHVKNGGIDTSVLSEGGFLYDAHRQVRNGTVPKSITYATIGRIYLGE